MPTRRVKQPKQSPDARAWMELAVEVMQRSTQEQRDDTKATPLVGAVLVKTDGTAETAYRGEIRDGDHAEYTLLERKNRSVALDGCRLFATLEPCAPGSRRHPKLGCAERIVLARIREVWIGVADPDPTVDRKGIAYLEKNGVTVHMFDRDLQERILELNRDFIGQAIERAKAAQSGPEEIILSSLEKPRPNTELHELSLDALNQYRTRARIDAPVESSEFHRILLNQGFLKEDRGVLRPTGFGILAFGKQPRQLMPQAGLLAMIHYSEGEERREFNEPLVLIPDLVEQWLRDKLPSIVDRSSARRRELPALPYEVIREGVVNALVHRDYDIAGAKSHLDVSADKVVIRSPGAPPSPITVEQMQSFTAPMLSRNPPLHYVFAQMELAEEQGLGIRAMRSRAQGLGLPSPRYQWNAPYLDLTLFRTLEATTADRVPGGMSPDELSVWNVLQRGEPVSLREIRTLVGFDDRKIQRILRKLVEQRVIRRTGEARATRYEVVP